MLTPMNRAGGLPANLEIRMATVRRLPFFKGGAIMEQRTTRVNPSEETIKIGPLGIRVNI